MGLIAEALEIHTASISKFDPHRDYISLSHVHLSAQELFDQFVDGFHDSRPIRLKCYKGYQMEADLVKRIMSTFTGRVQIGIEIRAFDGLVLGHPDFLFDGYPADCKSILMDEWLPRDAALPRRIYWQMQAYMKYGNFTKSLVVLESRETGYIIERWLHPNLAIQSQIDAKLADVVRQIRAI
jgi:hypothetical protein